MFCPFGTIREAVVIPDRLTSRSRCYGFVTFTTASSVHRVLDQSPFTLNNGRTLTVTLAASNAKPRRARFTVKHGVSSLSASELDVFRTVNIQSIEPATLSIGSIAKGDGRKRKRNRSRSDHERPISERNVESHSVSTVSDDTVYSANDPDGHYRPRTAKINLCRSQTAAPHRSSGDKGVNEKRMITVLNEMTAAATTRATPGMISNVNALHGMTGSALSINPFRPIVLLSDASVIAGTQIVLVPVAVPVQVVRY